MARTTLARLLGAAALLIALSPSAAAAATQVVLPVADAYVTSSYSGTNYGTATSLQMNASPSARAFLRFNVSLPSGATVTGARLNMYSTSTSPSAGYQAYAVSNTTWGETSITSGNAPAFGAKLGGSATWTAPSRASRYRPPTSTPG